MKKSELIDMFGLNGDSSNHDQLDDLLFCLESDIPNVLETNSKVTCLPSFAPITVASSRSSGVEKRNRIVSDLTPPDKAQGLLHESLPLSMRRIVAQR